VPRGVHEIHRPIVLNVDGEVHVLDGNGRNTNPPIG